MFINNEVSFVNHWNTVVFALRYYYNNKVASILFVG